MSEFQEIRRAVTVTGTVQGVSYRWYTMQEANRLGLVGWVRNERDGTVQLEVQGPEADVEQLIAWLHSGPPLARVVGVDVEEIAPTTVDIDFSVEH